MRCRGGERYQNKESTRQCGEREREYTRIGRKARLIIMDLVNVENSMLTVAARKCTDARRGIIIIIILYICIFPVR